MRADPLRTTFQAPGAKLLKIENDKLPSNFAFNFNLRHYIKGGTKGAKLDMADLKPEKKGAKGHGFKSSAKHKRKR